MSHQVGGWDLNGLKDCYLPRVWIKNPSVVSTSLTLRSYTDLRRWFHLIVFWWAWKWNVARVQKRPFDVVMQNVFYVSWSVWDRAGRPKTQLESFWMWVNSRGGVRQGGANNTGWGGGDREGGGGNVIIRTKGTTNWATQTIRADESVSLTGGGVIVKQKEKK